MGIPGGEDVSGTEVWRLMASGVPQQCQNKFSANSAPWEMCIGRP